MEGVRPGISAIVGSRIERLRRWWRGNTYWREGIARKEAEGRLCMDAFEKKVAEAAYERESLPRLHICMGITSKQLQLHGNSPNRREGRR